MITHLDNWSFDGPDGEPEPSLMFWYVLQFAELQTCFPEGARDPPVEPPSPTPTTSLEVWSLLGPGSWVQASGFWENLVGPLRLLLKRISLFQSDSL